MVLALFLAAGNAMAAGAPSGLHDSTWLADDSVMSKTVGQPNSGVPLGSIIVWSNAGMPAASTNWRECDGQSLSGTQVCKRLGICTAPNYRGYFLRGHGGNSGELNAEQKDGIYISPDYNYSITLNGLGFGDILHHEGSTTFLSRARLIFFIQ